VARQRPLAATDRAARPSRCRAGDARHGAGLEAPTVRGRHRRWRGLGPGAVDNKGSLIGLFEAIESLAAAGFKPGRTVIVVSGHDEEAGGAGAAAAAQLLKSRNVQAEFVLDEGLIVVEDFPLLGRPVALIGIAEKGYGTLRITAPAQGGHSSTPPPQTGVEVLAKALLAITSKPFSMRFEGPAAEMVRTLARARPCRSSWPWPTNGCSSLCSCARSPPRPRAPRACTRPSPHHAAR